MAKVKLVKVQRQYDPEGAIQRHKRWTIYTSLGFLISSAILIPFFRPNPWNKDWNVGGKYLLTVDLIFFIAAVFEAGFTWVLWSTVRDIKRIDDQAQERKRKSNQRQ